MGINKKAKLIESANKRLLERSESNTPEYPSNHKAGMKVPKGGSSCDSCIWVSKDKKKCTNKYWIKWHDNDDNLPLPADEYCSDWYEH